MKIVNNLRVTRLCCQTKIIELFYLTLNIIFAFIVFSTKAAVTVDPAEMVQKNQWVQQNLLTATNLPPFSFLYRGQSSSILLPSWKREETSAILDPKRVQHVIVWSNDELLVRCVVVEYTDYPEVEWTTYIKNVGTNNTPIVENIQGLDTSISRMDGSEFVLRGNQGDFCAEDSYKPFNITLKPSTEIIFSPPSYSGKSCDGTNGWPYYNLQTPSGGIIMAVGWPGQWASSFRRDAANVLRIQAGQQLTHLFLKPGEEIRTPLIAMLFWQGTDFLRSQNIWRHFYLAHLLPRVGGRPQGPLKQIQVNGDDINYVQSFMDAGIHPDICWRDAGAGVRTWYPSDDGPYAPGEHPDQKAFANMSWLNTGTWEVDNRLFTNGFRPFSDWVREHNMKFLLWFEPERVGSPTSWLGKNHPEWLLPATNFTGGAILNLGKPEALNWLVNHIDGLIKSQGIDWYREDMNGGGPLPAWRNNDAPDREGITENLYVQGHLKYWDELKRRNPGLSIDSCASGGRRNDLETMRRAVPLLRSDFQFPDTMKGVSEGNQGHTYGLSFWFPFQGSGVLSYDPYSYRSSFMASFGMGGLTSENKAAQRQAYAECEKIAPDMLFGDYYPLTPYTLDEDAWIAWQFDRPETGEGCVQAFRHAKSALPAIRLKLQGLDASKTYEIRDFNKNNTSSYSGDELMQKGITVILGVRESDVFTYKMIQPTGKSDLNQR